jgi:hypothetical protein
MWAMCGSALAGDAGVGLGDPLQEVRARRFAEPPAWTPGEDQRIGFFGKIGKKLAIMGTLWRNGQVLTGVCGYEKTQKLIALSGVCKDDGTVSLEEFARPGENTGRFVGHMESDAISGIWSSPDGSRNLPFQMKTIGTRPVGLVRPDGSMTPPSWKTYRNDRIEFRYPPELKANARGVFVPRKAWYKGTDMDEDITIQFLHRGDTGIFAKMDDKWVVSDNAVGSGSPALETRINGRRAFLGYSDVRYHFLQGGPAGMCAQFSVLIFGPHGNVAIDACANEALWSAVVSTIKVPDESPVPAPKTPKPR